MNLVESQGVQIYELHLQIAVRHAAEFIFHEQTSRFVRGTAIAG
jgi:hypothetical protein